MDDEFNKFDKIAIEARKLLPNGVFTRYYQALSKLTIKEQDEIANIVEDVIKQARASAIDEMRMGIRKHYWGKAPSLINFTDKLSAKLKKKTQPPNASHLAEED